MIAEVEPVYLFASDSKHIIKARRLDALDYYFFFEQRGQQLSHLLVLTSLSYSHGNNY